MKRFFLLLFFPFVLSPVLSAQETIHMEKDGGIYKVPCTVNGLKLKFYFDTGATNVTISRATGRNRLILVASDMLLDESRSDYHIVT